MALEDVSFYDVESSNINQIGYDENEMTLFVRFNNGSLYWYAGVDIGTWQALLNAESFGKHFWAYIRNAGYEYGQV